MEFMYEGDTVPPIDWPTVLKATVDKAVMEERERCAKICASSNRDNSSPWVGTNAGLHFAELIRGTS